MRPSRGRGNTFLRGRGGSQRFSRPGTQPSRGGSSQAPTRRGHQASRGREPQAAKEKTWERSEKMLTANRLMHDDRQKVRQAVDEEYTGQPPSDRELFECRMILALPPQGIQGPYLFDDIRKTHKVYITVKDVDVLVIQSDSVRRMQKAVKAINWLLHDLRLSSKSSPSTLLLQELTHATQNSFVKYSLGTRPQVTSRLAEIANGCSFKTNLHQKLSAEIESGFSRLAASNRSYKMRVNYGFLSIKITTKRTPEAIAMKDFERKLSWHSENGGAELNTSSEDIDAAESFIRSLANPENGHCHSIDNITQSGEVRVKIGSFELFCDLIDRKDMSTALSKATVMRSEVASQFNCVVAAPDMSYDWSLTVDSCDHSEELPLRIGEVEKKLDIITKLRKIPAPWSINMPTINTSKLASLENDINEIRLTKFVRIPYKDTPYAIEVNITKTWPKGGINNEPDVTWGIQLLGKHWDVSVGHSQNWGEGFVGIWSGAEPGLEARLGQFLHVILEVQSLLEVLLVADT